MKHLLKSRELRGIGIFESLYPAKLRQARHTHALASFSFVLAGSYVEIYGAQSQTRQPSTIVFRPPQESHAVNFQDGPVRILSAQMSPERFSNLAEQRTVLSCRTSRRTEVVAWLGRRLYHEFRREDDASTLALEGLVLEILGELSRARITTEKTSPGWLKQAEDFLRDNFTESFCFDEVAKTVGVHPVHLARVFRQKNHCTMGEYVRRLRIDLAARQIANSNVSLREVALAAGFADQSYLTRSFKNYFGVTPSAYRRTLATKMR